MDEAIIYNMPRFPLVLFGNLFKKFYKVRNRLCSVFYIVPFTLYMDSFIHNSYGFAGVWCWIRNWKDDCATQKYLEGIIEQFVLWYGPLFISLTLSVVAVFIILIVLAQRAYANKNPENKGLYERNQNKKAIKELLPLLAYPVIFYVLWLFPLINRIYNATSPNANFGLAIVHTSSEFLWGFFSSCALIIHILVMRKLKKKKRVQIKELPI